MAIQFDPLVASQGLAAGLAGNLPQFQQTQNQKAQLDLEKKKQDDEMQIKIQESQFKDAYAAQQLLSSEDYDGIVKLGITRLSMLQGLNANPAETQRVLQIAIAARNGNEEARKLLKGELDSAVKVGVATGVLKAPEKQGVTSVNPEYDVIDAAGNLVRAGTKKDEKRETKEDALGVLRYVDDGSVVPGFEATAPSGSEAAIKAQADTITFPDGSMKIVSTDGSIKYYGSDGEQITGAANIAEFNKRTSELSKTEAGIVATNTLAMKNATTKSEQGREQANAIRGNSYYLDQAIAALNEGANTGSIVKRFPTLTDAGQKLDQVQRNLGLNIVQATTFGALSRGELDLALATALPTGLSEEALIEWIKTKKAADEKVASIIEEASDYMGIPGNTIAGYYREKREQYNQDVAAVKYARENPNDPNSADILAANPNL
jgi:hypothetical protein